MMIDRNIHLAYFDPKKGHMRNPGMGIHAYVFSDHMHYGFNAAQFSKTEHEAPNRKLKRETLDRMLQLPYTDNLYFRTDWCNIQKEKGRLHIQEELEWLLEAVRESGRKWSFRIMNSSRHSVKNNSVPDFLQDRLEMLPYQNQTCGHGTSYYPAYTEEYLKWWEELLHLLADRFDDDPSLEFVDISGYGIWGEGHHYGMHGQDRSNSNRHAPNAEEVLTRLITAHDRIFAKTPVAMTLHYLDYQAGVDAVENTSLWLRRDSFQRFVSKYEYEAVAKPKPGRAILWETIVPEVREMQPVLFSRERLVQRYLDWGAHYVAMGFNPWEVIYAHQFDLGLYEQIAEKIGYRIRPSVIMRRVNEREEHELIVVLTNDGCVSPPGTLTLTAAFPSGKNVSLELPMGAPEVNDRRYYTLPFPKEDFACTSGQQVTLTLQLRMKGKVHPVKWAVRQPLADEYKASAPLIMPCSGDPFLTPSGTYEPEL